MLMRLRYQDIVSVVLMVSVFIINALISLLALYHLSYDPSPKAYYCDRPILTTTEASRMICHGNDSQAFLHCFNTPPSLARLRIIGLKNFDGLFDSSLCGSLRSWCGGRTDDSFTVFDVSLDLTPFIHREGWLASNRDAERLEKHLRSQNPLEIITIRKEVLWQDWEDLAFNVRQRLRELGCEADSIEVKLEAFEEIQVHRNTTWQNFVRSPACQFVMLVSVVGLLFWLPYLHVRSRTVKIFSRFQIELNLPIFWDEISQNLHPTFGYLPSENLSRPVSPMSANQ